MRSFLTGVSVSLFALAVAGAAYACGGGCCSGGGYPTAYYGAYPYGGGAYGYPYYNPAGCGSYGSVPNGGYYPVPYGSPGMAGMPEMPGMARGGAMPNGGARQGGMAMYGGQKTCPVTGEKLGSMGAPIPVTVRGQTIYVCCRACIAKVQRDPDTYLRKVQAERASQRAKE